MLLLTPAIEGWQGHALEVFVAELTVVASSKVPEGLHPRPTPLPSQKCRWPRLVQLVPEAVACHASMKWQSMHSAPSEPVGDLRCIKVLAYRPAARLNFFPYLVQCNLSWQGAESLPGLRRRPRTRWKAQRAASSHCTRRGQGFRTRAMIAQMRVRDVGQRRSNGGRLNIYNAHIAMHLR